MFSVVNCESLLQYLPQFLFQKVLSIYYSGTDFGFTSIPISETPVYFFNREILNFAVFTNISRRINAILTITTYKKMAKFMMIADANIKMDTQALLDIFVDKLISDKLE